MFQYILQAVYIIIIADRQSSCLPHSIPYRPLTSIFAYKKVARQMDYNSTHVMITKPGLTIHIVLLTLAWPCSEARSSGVWPDTLNPVALAWLAIKASTWREKKRDIIQCAQGRGLWWRNGIHWANVVINTTHTHTHTSLQWMCALQSRLDGEVCLHYDWPHWDLPPSPAKPVQH